MPEFPAFPDIGTVPLERFDDVFALLNKQADKQVEACIAQGMKKQATIRKFEKWLEEASQWAAECLENYDATGETRK